MYSSNIGTLIRQLRKEKKLTAEELAFEAGCDVTTLSRIENNKFEPSARVFEAIMSKLGLDPHASYDIWVMAKDYNTFKKIKELNIQLFQKKYDQAMALIDELEKHKSFQQGLNLQFLYSAKAVIYSSKKESPSMIIQFIHDALSLTKQFFHERYLEDYYLSYDEIILLNLLAVQYARLDNLERASEVLYKVKRNMEKSFIDEQEKAKTYPLIVCNLTKYLGLLGRHTEVVELSRAARDFCIKLNKIFILPDILANYGCALYYIGDHESSEKYFKQAYVLFQALDRYLEANQTKAYVKENFQIII